MGTPIATTKGALLKSLIKFIDTDLTPAQKEQALAALTPEERAVATSRMLPSQQVPESLLNHLTETAAKARAESLERFGIRAGRAELKDSIGFYRFLVVVLTPASLLAKASSAWGTVHNTGTLTVEAQTPGTARIRLRDFASVPAHCARLTGWIAGLSEMTGAKNVTILHDECLADGKPDCSWNLRWS